MKLSFTTVVRNELDNLKQLMPKVSKCVDEIVIVDTGSTDGTVDYLLRGGATVIEASLEDGFSAARNLGLEQCTGDWIFSLDADERPTTGLMKWLLKSLDGKARSLVFRRVTTVNGNQVADEYIVRAFRKGYGKWVGKIHESVQTPNKYLHAQCPDSLFIRHDKSSARQADANRLYLQFYPKFNLGSGGKPMPVDEGWINFDIDPEHAPDSEYADVFDKLPGSLPASYILASHVLEHVTYHKTAPALATWIKRLAPGGTIEVRVPDAGSVMKAYVAGEIHYLRLIQLLYGGQTTDWDYHKIAIDEAWLTGQFSWNRLEGIRRLPGSQDHELIMVGRKPL